MEFWKDAHDIFIRALAEFLPRTEQVEQILPIHGSNLGGFNYPRRNHSSKKDREFEERARRERALYEMRSVALPKFQKILLDFRGEEETGQTLEDLESEFQLYQLIVNSINLDTPMETLEMYCSILTVQPFIQ